MIDDDDNPFPEPVEIEITDVFDLHTIQPRDVQRVVEEYLQIAHEKGFISVRIIHGKGIGVQREMVRSVSPRSNLVCLRLDRRPTERWRARRDHSSPRNKNRQ